MKSPFPGMDPYIEASGFWRDFHSDLIAEIKRAVASALPPQYRVRVEEREVVELVEQEGKGSSPMYPDVGVTGPSRPVSSAAENVAVAEPYAEETSFLLRPLIAEEFRERYIEILVTRPDRRLVTCIEILSPSNKRPHSDGRNQYLRKRQALLLGDTNLVEIDLLRGGEPMPMRDPWPNCPYRLLVSRGHGKEICRVWPGYCHQRLPMIPVPLDTPDADLPLELQPMIEAIYERSRYGADIDYTKPLEPPLSAEVSQRIVEHLRGREK